MNKLKYIFCLGLFFVSTAEVCAQNNFPFLKPGNQWVYVYDAGNGPVEFSYKIISIEKNGYVKVAIKIDNDFVTNSYWHADSNSFSWHTDWPLSKTKLTLYTNNCKPGDSWTIFSPQNEIENPDGLWGNQTIQVIAINEKVNTPVGTFENCVRVKETFSSDPKYFSEYFIDLQYGLVKIEGIGRIFYGEGEEKKKIYYPIKYELKGKEEKEEKPSILIAGCESITVGESSILNVSYTPAGGKMRYWAEGIGVTVSDAGNGAKIQGTAAGKAIIWAEYTTAKGEKIKKSHTVHSLKVNSLNDNKPLQIGLYNAKGKPTDGIKTIAVSVQPASGIDHVKFKPKNTALLSTVKSGAQLKVQGVQLGKTTVQAYSDCDTQIGPPLDVEIVNCDDKVIDELRSLEKQLKSRLESNLKQVADLLGNKDFIDADEKGVKAIKDIQIGLEDIAITLVTNGVITNVLKKLSDYRSLKNDIISGSERYISWQLFIMSMPEGVSRTVQTLVKTMEQTMTAAHDLGGYLGTLDGVIDRLHELEIQYEKTAWDLQLVQRVLYKVCKRDSGPPEPNDLEPGEIKEPPAKQPPIKQKPKETKITASGGHDEKPNVTKEEKKSLDEIIAEPDPPEKGPENIDRGLLFSDENCDCVKEGKSNNLMGFKKFSAGIKELKHCVEDFQTNTLKPLQVEATQMKDFFEKIEIIKSLPADQQIQKIKDLLKSPDKNNGENLELKIDKVAAFQKSFSGCKMNNNLIENLKIHWNSLL
ncbi:MAG: hypothetical protein ABIN48_13605 [Ginsengibacter sp.]